MSKKVLVTGITGMVGSWLAEYCLRDRDEVHGLVRHTTNHRNIAHIEEDLCLHIGDMKDLACIQGIMREVDPDYVFHLAAMSYVPQSFVAPAETLYNNVVGTANVLEAAPDHSRIAIACSSEEYGYVLPEEVPITEENPLRPKSPYGVSKVATDYLGYYYFGIGKHVVRLRCFNTEGPRRHELFVTSAFAKQVAEIEKGKRKVLKVGNLEAIRDFTDVRDIVKAYRLAVDKAIFGEVYNVATGVGHKISEVLDLLLYEVDMNPKVEQDPKLMRASEVPLLIGNSTKFRNRTGWEPKIPFEVTIRDLLNWWRMYV